MARQRKRSRVLGPYPHRGRWRVVVVDEGGERNLRSYETEKKAQQVAKSLRRELGGDNPKTVDESVDLYRRYLLNEKGNKSASVATTEARLFSFFPDHELLVRTIDEERCRAYYETLRSKNATDTHRNVLAEVKTFFGWCVKRGFTTRNPVTAIEGIGRRRKGKKQLRIDEARLWIAVAQELASTEPGAVAAMVTLLMGFRAGEVVDRIVRDVDDHGRLLWVTDSKTEAGRRTVQVPEALRPHLLRLAEGRKPEERLFGRHWRDWPREWVQRICKLAKVPVVTAHGMRGLHATLAEESGVTAHVVAKALGHESPTTTHEHYSQASAVQNAAQHRVLNVLEGERT